VAKSAEEKRQYDRDRRSKARLDKKTRNIPDQLLGVVSFIKPGLTPEKVALNYAKMMRRTGFDVPGLMGLNPTMFNNESKARRVIVLLRNNGLVAQLDNGYYAITTRGENAIIVLSNRDRSKSVENDGDDW
jgi:hypothetical protein